MLIQTADCAYMYKDLQLNMSRDAKKTAVWVSDQVHHKPVCTFKDNGKRLEISDLDGSRNELFM